ncbi:MAG: DUF2336 domain-containing protein [Rhodospirillales bacterium]
MAAGGGIDDRAYHRDKLTAKAGDEEARIELAARSDVRPEILYYLTEDESTEVRRTLASNDSLPRQADVLLAADAEVAVRTDLAEKISRLVPDLDAATSDKVQQMTLDVLETLARDQAVKVRQILAETLRDVASAPSQVINRLARDVEIVVAKPILTFSPVLTDDDLLDIIASGPIAGALGAIAERRDVTHSVSDAIIETDDIGAIGLLLNNESAQIREEAIDRIIERATDVESWHLPLVSRPTLPERAAVRLARFVAESLIGTLIDRGDIAETDIAAIRQVVSERIDSGEIDGDSLADSWAASESRKDQALVDVDDLQPGDGGAVSASERVAQLVAEGQLDHQVVATAFDDGDVDFAILAVAELGGLTPDLVRCAVERADAKGIIAVCGAAGLPAGMLVAAQRGMGGVSLADTIKPDGDEYPLDADAMDRAIEDLKIELADESKSDLPAG